MKASATHIDLLTYKIDTLEKRIEQLEAAREGREKELLALLVGMLNNKDSSTPQQSPSEHEPAPVVKKCTHDSKQSTFSIISSGRRRTMV